MTMENKNLNIPNVTVNELVELLTALYVGAVEEGMAFREIAYSPMLWGPPGVGKSQLVRQLAENLHKHTGRQVCITDVRLHLFNPCDLRGIPTANADKTLAVWLKPKIFQMDPDENVINLLFLDELTAAPQSVQDSAYQICLDRCVGEHALPDNCVVIAAGNRTTDHSISYKMSKALANRLLHFNVEPSYPDWLKWARSRNLDGRIVGYLAFDNSRLCIDVADSGMAYGTPRSWEMVNTLLRCVDDEKAVKKLVGSCVGTDTAHEFFNWMKTNKNMPSVEDVLQGCAARQTMRHDVLLAFATSLVAAVRSRRESITARELENLCAYIKGFPADFVTMIYGDLNAMEDVRLKLMKCPSSRVG